MEEISQVSVIIPTMPHRSELLKRLLDSLPAECEKIVMGDEKMLLAEKRNRGARLAKGKYLLFIDDDNYLKDGAIYEMLRQFNEYVGVIGMTACYDDKKMRVADGGSIRGILGFSGEYISGFTRGLRTNWPLHQGWNEIIYPTQEVCKKGLYPVDEVANAFMIRRDVFDDVGGFDEVNFPIDLDEADICKRINDMGYQIVMNPKAICYHKSQTYSHIPNFRRPMNAYFMGRNRVLYQRKHNNDLRYGVYFVFFMPVFVVFYVASLLFKKNPVMIPHFLKGVLDGLLGRLENKYQPR